MDRLSMATVVCGVIALCGCSLVSKRDQPVDISKDAPSVEMVIQAVQDAIDSTAMNPGWKGSADFKELSATCQEKGKKRKNEHETACVALVASARKACQGLSGPAAPALCSDHLQAANGFCARMPGPAEECLVAEAVAPVTIKSAVLKFSAATSRESSVGTSLKLISAAHTRQYGRTSSFEIELIPDPTRVRRNLHSSQYNLDELGALLLAALNAGASCEERTSDRGNDRDGTRSLTCNLSNTPQLIMRRAKFGLDISYTQSNSGKIEWSVSSLRIVDGTAGWGRTQSLGNTLTIELGRGG